MKASFKGLILCAGIFGSAQVAQAHVPHPSQIARFQPGLLSRARAFESSGNIQFQGHSIGYVLSWISPETYSIRLTRVPANLYAQGRGPDSWTLVRRQTLCLIKTDSRVVNCPSPQAWALLELSGVPEAGARGLFTADILELSEIAYQETDASVSEDLDQRRVGLVIAKQGKTPAAHLEIRGRNADTRNPGLEHPLIRFDQTFLAPLLLRVRSRGEIFTVTASSDLEVRRGRTRYTSVLATELVVESNLQHSLIVKREEAKPSPNAKLPTIEKSLSQVDVLRDTLSVSGQFLLDALLLTH
jgi:hypothetical protein